MDGVDGVEQDRELIEQQAREVLQRILVARGALSLEELTGALAAEEPELAAGLVQDRPGTELGDRLQGLIRGAEEFWQLVDGRLAAVLHRLRRATFTHLVTADEVAREAIDLSPDLVALALPRTFELDGTEVRVSEPEQDLRAAAEGSILGPDGWLRGAGVSAGSLVAVRYDGTVARMEPIGEDGLDPASSAAAADAIAQTAEQVWDQTSAAGGGGPAGRAPELHHVMVETIGLHPALFSTALAPVTALLTLAGLRTREAWVGPIDEEWATPAEQARRRRLEGLLDGADSCCKRSARAALKAWLSWMEASSTSSSDSSAEQLKHVGPDVAEDIDHGPVAAMLVELAVIGRSLLSLRRLGEWATAIAEATGSAESTGAAPNAGVAYLQAVGADASGEGAAAEEHLQAALRRTPDHPACLGFLAELTQDRGDAIRSLELLRRTGRPPSGPALAQLEPFLPSRKVGRNDPCPCGSGRKFKACCARGPQVLPETRAEWLLSKACRFVLRTDPGSVRSLQQLFGMTEPGASGEIPPTVWDLVLFPRGLSRYLDTRGPLLPAEELDRARNWPDQPLRLLQVVTQGSDTLQATDLRTGDPLQLVGRSLPSAMPPGDTFLGRALPIDERWLLTDAILPVPEAGRERALTMLEKDVRAFQILELLVDMQVAALRA
ncbi:MAG: SEC-C metal-binding domain-containing protein [Acidimicrobiales bacterium]